MAVTVEFKILVLAIVLGFVHILLAAHAASLQRGYRWTARWPGTLAASTEIV